MLLYYPENENRGRATNFSKGRAGYEFSTKLSSRNQLRADRSSQLLKFIPGRATVSRNLKEEAKDEPASGVGYEVFDLFVQK